MSLHILDLIMYLILVLILWKVLELSSNGSLTEELGGMVGELIIIIFTILYGYIFVFCDYNWVDIFNGEFKSWIKIKW